MRVTEQFDRLRWQSRLLVAMVPPLCAAAAFGFAVRTWTAATRTALLISLAFAIAAWISRAATPTAAITGGVLTAAMVLMSVATGGGVWLGSALSPLLALFLLTLAATRFGKGKKQRMGVAEDRRLAAQVTANLGIAALTGAAVLALSLSGRHAPTFSAAMLVAALAEATADTVSSELGEVLGGEPFLITTRKPVAAGTDGAVSLVGTLTGATGAAVIVLVAAFPLGLTLPAALAAGAGALGGLFFDSLLGATLEHRGWLNNDAVNFLSTLAAALLTMLLLIF